MIRYNLYYGTREGNLKAQYRISKFFESSKDAYNAAKEAALSLYYKNEGTLGIPSYSSIIEESKITGIDITDLYEDHLKDLFIWFAIPTNVDTVSKTKLRNY